jgi:peptide deformylase
MKLTLVESTDPVLTQVAEPVDEITTEIRELANSMVDLMKSSNGIGLAAPQVGHSIRLIVIHVPNQQSEPVIMVNPVVARIGRVIDEGREGCLSFPNLIVSVSRPNRITIDYTDLDGNKQSLNSNKLLARCIQHELDHLDGITLKTERN